MYISIYIYIYYITHTRYQDYRPKTRYFKQLDFDTKFLKIIQKPQTPHNTGQYITHIFNSTHSGGSQVDNSNSNNNTGMFNLDSCFACGSMLDVDVDGINNNINNNNNPQDNFDIDDNLNYMFFPPRRHRYMSYDITSFNEISLLNPTSSNQPIASSLAPNTLTNQ